MLQIQKLDFLISLYIFCIAASELMGGKTFPILSSGSIHLNSSVAIFVLPIIFTINDIITEVFGKQRARSIVRSGLIVIFFILLYSLLVTHLPASSRFLPQEKSYEAIFGISARISASSLTAFAIAEFTDVFIFSRLRAKLGKKALWFRTNAANFVSMFLDSAVFIFLAFYAFDKTFAMNFPFLVSLILPYWFLKCCMSLIETPFVYLGAKWLRKDLKREG